MRRIMFYLLLVLAFISSCKKAEDRSCWKSKGELVVVERSMASFDALELFDGIDYKLIQDSMDYLVIRTGENLIQHLETNVASGVLQIKDNNNCNFLRELPANIEVEIHYTSIYSVYNESYGSITGSIDLPDDFFQWDNWNGATNIDLTLNLDSAEFAMHTGAPSLIARGQINRIWFYTSGYCHIDGSNLIALHGQAHNTGFGDIKIHVENGWLNCVVTNFGNVYHTGNYGEIHKDDTGEGSIIEF